jgi:hypothetical protein
MFSQLGREVELVYALRKGFVRIVVMMWVMMMMVVIIVTIIIAIAITV